MLTISDIEKELKKYFNVKGFEDRVEIHEFYIPPILLITLDDENVVITGEIMDKHFINKVPIEEFIYCMERGSREIYMLRMFCRKCTNFMYCASTRKSLSECTDTVFSPQ